MIRLITLLLAFIAIIYLPWPVAALLALLLAPFEPFAPLALGIFTDTLYYSSGTASFPHFAFAGVLVTALTLLVRTRLRAGIIR